MRPRILNIAMSDIGPQPCSPIKEFNKTALGREFGKRITSLFGINEVISYCTVINDTLLNLDIFVEGKTGDYNGRLLFVGGGGKGIPLEPADPTTKMLWNAFEDSFKKSEGSLEIAERIRMITYRFYDLLGWNRFGILMKNTPIVQAEMYKEFPDAKYIIRGQGDQVPYYIIFKDDDELKKAERLYGFDKMTDYAWKLFAEDDMYGSFAEKPIPKIVTKDMVNGTGIIRNFPSLGWI